MEQNYKLEIVNELLKNNNHIRSISKNLNTNHMNIQRKIKELFNENVVDYKKEGKNKVFFLKNNIEAKQYIFMTENYNLLKILKRYPVLRRVFDEIQKNKQINLAILFGSYAKKISKADSDIDIYVETINKKLKQDLERSNTRLSIKIGEYNKDNLLIKEIAKNHIIIKGIELYYEKRQFFE